MGLKTQQPSCPDCGETLEEHFENTSSPDELVVDEIVFEGELVTDFNKLKTIIYECPTCRWKPFETSEPHPVQFRRQIVDGEKGELEKDPAV